MSMGSRQASATLRGGGGRYVACHSQARVGAGVHSGGPERTPAPEDGQSKMFHVRSFEDVLPRETRQWSRMGNG